MRQLPPASPSLPLWSRPLFGGRLALVTPARARPRRAAPPPPPHCPPREAGRSAHRESSGLSVCPQAPPTPTPPPYPALTLPPISSPNHRRAAAARAPPAARGPAPAAALGANEVAAVANMATEISSVAGVMCAITLVVSLVFWGDEGCGERGAERGLPGEERERGKRERGTPTPNLLTLHHQSCTPPFTNRASPSASSCSAWRRTPRRTRSEHWGGRERESGGRVAPCPESEERAVQFFGGARFF